MNTKVVIFLIVSLVIAPMSFMAFADVPPIPSNVFRSVGTVTEITGFVRAMNDKGGARILRMGNAVYAGETILTSPNSRICFKAPVGEKKCVGPSEKYKA
jgi:hypothetical protein